MTRKRGARLFGAGVVLVGGIGVPVLFGAEGAQAATCGTAGVTGVSCTLTGTLGLGAGNLGLTLPAGLGWTGDVTGVDQSLADLTDADETYVVDDSTGSGTGWAVTLSATSFTLGTTATILPDATAFETNGNPTLETDATAPTATCSPITGGTTASACTLPTDGVTYPVPITTYTGDTVPAGDTATIYDAAATTGVGSIIIGGSGAANPVGWWLNIPASALAGTYTSTITIAIVNAP